MNNKELIGKCLLLRSQLKTLRIEFHKTQGQKDNWSDFVSKHQVIKAIPIIRAEERKGILGEYKTLFQFAEKVAIAMDDIKSSHVFFILQQAFGDEDWGGSQDILDTVIAQSKSLKEGNT